MIAVREKARRVEVPVARGRGASEGGSEGKRVKTENRFTWDDEVTGCGLEEKVFIRELTRGLILLDGPVHILAPSCLETCTLYHREAALHWVW